MALLRDGLLSGRGVAGAELTEQVLDALVGLGGRVEPLAVAELSEDEEHVGDWARVQAPIHALVYDARPQFGTGGAAGLAAVTDPAWVAVREVAVGALIPADRPGKIVLIGPPPDGGELASAAVAGLENLVRTLSVEWARYSVTTTMVAPRDPVMGEELAQIVCFLCSPAGEYFSGCRVEIGGR